MRKKHLLVCLVSFFVLATTLGAETGTANPDVSLDSKRLAFVKYFFSLINTQTAPCEEFEKRCFGNLKDVRGILSNIKEYQNTKTPISAFVQSQVAPIFGNRQSFTTLIYGPTHTTRLTDSKLGSNQNSLIAVANLDRHSTCPPLAVVFFEFVTGSDQLIVSPVILKSDSSTSLYDLALRKKTELDQQ